MALVANPALSAAKEPELVIAGLFCQMANGGHKEGVEYLLSKSLLEKVQAAQAKNDELQAATPDEKPPLGDGVPYQSFPDLAPVCRASEVLEHSEAILVTIEYEFPDTPDANWKDRLRLKWDGGLLRIDDIRYGPDYATGLRATLDGMFPQ